MKLARTTMSILLLLVLCATSIADEGKAAKPAVSPKTHEHIVSMMGARIGWEKSTSSRKALDGIEYDYTFEESYFCIKRSFDRRVFTTTATAETWAMSDGAKVRNITIVKDANKTETTTVEYKEDRAVISVQIDEGKAVQTTLTYGDNKVQSSDQVFITLQKNGKWKKGLKHTYYTVDVESQAIVKENWHVIGQSEQLLLDGTTVKGMKVSITSNGQLTTVIVDEAGDELYMETSNGIALEITDKIPDPFKVETVQIETTMTSNFGIPNDKRLTELEIAFKWKHDDAADDIPQIIDANRYHDVARLDDSFVVRMKSQKLEKDFELAYPLKDIPEDIEVFLKPTPHCQSDDKVLAAKGISLAKGQKDALKVAEEISRFVRTRLKAASGDSGNASAKQAYIERTGDCTEHSALFVALARSAGLPARNIGGIVYIYDSRRQLGFFGYHAWSEVWLGKWVPVDATVKEVGTSARYLMFEINEPGNVYGRGRTSRCLRQRIRPKIVGYKKEDGHKWRKKDLPKYEYETAKD